MKQTRKNYRTDLGDIEKLVFRRAYKNRKLCKLRAPIFSYKAEDK